MWRYKSGRLLQWGSMGKIFVLCRIKLKFCSWLYKKRCHTNWKFQFEKSNKTLSPKTLWQTYMGWTVALRQSKSVSFKSINLLSVDTMYLLFSNASNYTDIICVEVMLFVLSYFSLSKCVARALLRNMSLELYWDLLTFSHTLSLS